jgi:cobalt-zinc-cadmium efflux system membrane fusion protein
VAVLGSLAWWGHSNAWKLPKFAALFGNAHPKMDDWCDEHAVPESECVVCNPSLFARPKLYGFCTTHGVHQCPFEHPDIAQVTERPTIAQADLDRADRALKFKYRPENEPSCKKHERLLQFASQAIFDKMGVGIKRVDKAAMVETVSASAELVFQQPLVAPLHTVVSGRVWKVTEQGMLGRAVKKGDVLALVESAEVGKAKAEFFQAHAQLELKTQTLTRLNELYKEGATSLASLRQAEAAQREADIRLLAAQQALINLGLPIRAADVKGLPPADLAGHIQFLGLPPEMAAKLNPATTTANLLPVLASRDGTVIEVKVAEGETVDPARTLFVVADPTRMWLLLNVRPEDASYLRLADPETKTPGNQVFFKPDGGGPEVRGELVWRSKVLGEKTRTLQFRADVLDPPPTAAAHSFGMAQVIVREEPSAIVVPREAVHWEGDCHVVFVRDKDWFKPGSPKVFHVRTVRPGVTNGESTEIIAGVLPGEIVATKNSAVLRAELLKNNLGLG